MSVRDTSMDAYDHLREEGKISEREQDVLNWVEEYNNDHEENGTAREIHAWLAGQKGNEEAQLNGPNYIKPRLTELKDKGYIEEGEKRECSVTGRKAYELKIAGKQETVVEEEDDYYTDEDGNRYIFDPTEDPEDDSGGKSEGRKELEKLAGVDEDEDQEEDDDEEKQTLLMQDGEVVS